MLFGLQASAMVVHVQSKEREALAVPEARQLGVEKVVAPAVQEQHRPPGGAPAVPRRVALRFLERGVPDECGGPCNAVCAHGIKGMGLEALAEDVVLPLHGTSLDVSQSRVPFGLR